MYEVSIEEHGPYGTIVYSEGGQSAKFPWEFGGKDVVAIITIPDPKQWEAETKFPLAARDEIVRHIAEEVIKRKARRCTYSIEPNWLLIKEPPKKQSFIQEALSAIHNQDGDVIEGLRDEIRPEHIPLLAATWQSSLPWPIKDGYVALLMDQLGEAVRPLMQDALSSPTVETRAYALCSLKGDLDSFTSLMTGGWVDPKKVEAALQEYLSAQRRLGKA